MAIELQKGIITLTSDFGDRFAEAQVEMVVHAVNPNAKFLALTGEVTPFSILEGAFLLSRSYRFSPRGSVHMAVVDPGVGSERRGIAVKTVNNWFVGPDNGVLYPAATKDGIEAVFVLDEGRLSTTGLNTFHGRDVFAPAAARILQGESISGFARLVDPKSITPFDLEPNFVGHVDRYGNVKTTNSPEGLKFGDELWIDLVTGRIKIPFCKTFADVPKGALLAYRGSHDTLELAKNLGSAAKALQIEVGQKLEFTVPEMVAID